MNTIVRVVSTYLSMIAWMTLAPICFAQVVDSVSPGAPDRITAIEGRCPTFVWGAVPGTEFFELVVYRLRGSADADSPAAIDPSTVDEVLFTRVVGSATAWVPPLEECLDAGGRYIWFARAVTELKDGKIVKVGEWSDARMFSISPVPSAQEVEHALDVLRRYTVLEHTAAESMARPDDSSQRPSTPLPAARRPITGSLPKTVTSGKTAIRGSLGDLSGETYGVVGISNSPDGAGLGAANTNSGPDLIIDGATDGQADAILTQGGIDRPSGSPEVFNIRNSLGNGMTLQVDGDNVVTTTTDQDTLASLSCASGEIAEWNGATWVCSAEAGHDHFGDTWAGSASIGLAVSNSTGTGLKGASSGGGHGVVGEATGTSTSGVYGTAAVENGRGVYGLAAAASGTTFGVYGETYSADGWGLYTPDRAHVGGDLSVGSSITLNASSGSISGTDFVGNASTATALSLDPSNCVAGSLAAGIAADGTAEGCIASSSSNVGGAIVQRDAGGNFTAGVITATLSGSASTANALSSNPANCTLGAVAGGVSATGVAEDCVATASSDTADSIVRRDTNGGFEASVISLSGDRIGDAVLSAVNTYTTASSYLTAGVWGRADNARGIGVFGQAASTTDDEVHYGGFFITQAGNKRIGVLGTTGDSLPAPSAIARPSGVVGVAGYASEDAIQGYQGFHSAPSLVFRVAYNGNVYADGTYSSPATDVAELFPTSEPLEPGDVVEIDPGDDATLTLSRKAVSTRVAGIVSTTPGVLLGRGTDDSGEDLVALAMTGRVPVKVCDQGGRIQPGDLLTTSSVPGHAMRCSCASRCSGAIVAKALQEFSGKRGVIVALVMLR